MKATTRNKRAAVAMYTGRKSAKVATVRHEHDTRLIRKSDTVLRWGCNTCPITGSMHLIDLTDVPNLAHLAPQAIKNGFTGTDASWTVDDEGYTPDEKPNVGGLYGDETVPRAPGKHKPVNHVEDDHDAPEENPDVLGQEPSNFIHADDTAAQMREKLGRMSKSVLMEQYGKKHGMFKSWTKDKMIDTIMENKKL